MREADVIAATREWIEKAVIGLNLCPFAEPVYVKDQVRFVVSRAPYPTLQLLREASIVRAMAAFPEADTINERNIKTLVALGRAGWDALWEAPPKR